MARLGPQRTEGKNSVFSYTVYHNYVYGNLHIHLSLLLIDYWKRS